MNQKIVIAIFSFLFLLFLSFYFITFRSHRIITIEKTNTECRYFDNKLGISRMYPNCTGKRTLNGINTTIRFNSFGHPTPNAGQKSSSGLRICILGGSNLVGLGIKEQHFPQKILQQELEKILKTKVELVNVSTEGYTTANHAILFNKTLSAYSPDIVLLYTVSDYKLFRDALVHDYTIKSNQGFQFQKIEQLNLPRFLLDLSFKYESIYALKQGLRTITENLHLIFLEYKLKNLNNSKLKQAQTLFEPTIDFIKSMQAQIPKSSNTKLFLITDNNNFHNYFPQRMNQYDKIDHIFNIFHPELEISNELFKEMLVKNNIDFINLTTEYLPSDFIGNSIYFNESGLKKTAKDIAQKLGSKLN